MEVGDARVPLGCTYSIHAREQGTWTRLRSRARPVHGSAGAPNPGTSWEASPKMTEVEHARQARGDGDRTRGPYRPARREQITWLSFSPD